jgi:prohibitin 1
VNVLSCRSTCVCVAALSSSSVDAGHRALIFDRFAGIKPQVIGEGTHIRVPILQRPIIMDVRIRPRTIATQTGTKGQLRRNDHRSTAHHRPGNEASDRSPLSALVPFAARSDLQNVNLSLRVLFHPSTTNLADLYRSLGIDYEERVLPSIGNEVLKAVVAQYDAAELLTLRDHVSRNIRDALEKRAGEFNIVVDDVSITHLNFSKDFSKAIEDKQVAEQNAERAKFVVAKAEQEKEALIIRSEGDAQAAQLVSDALHKAGKGLIELRRIETAVHVSRHTPRAHADRCTPSCTRSLGYPQL